MRGAGRLTRSGLLTLGVFVGGLVFAGAPALAAAPTVVSESVLSVTPFEARLEATARAAENPTPGEEPTECHFEYGKTSVGEHKEECEQGNALEGGEQDVSKTVTGLEPGKTYHYRVVVKNTTGEVKGTGNPVEEEFTTLTLEKPKVEGESFAGVTSSGVMLEAQVNPEYQETTCEFQYGTEEALTTYKTAPCTEPLGSGGGVVGANATVSGLSLGTPYYYRVVAKNATGEEAGGITPFATLGTAPLASTGAVSGVGQSSANVTGSVTPDGLETYYYYQYGSSTEYGQRTASSEPGVNVGAGLSSIEAPATLVPLTPGVSYHYRLVAWNEDGTSYGQDETFTTPAGLSPLAVTGSASGISVNGATISGAVNPQGDETSYRFEYGTDTGYGTQAFGTVLPEQGEQTVTLSLRGLEAGTTYHYRLVVSSPAGTSEGVDETFTTPPISDPLVNPTTPPLVATPSTAFPKEEKGTTGTTTKTLTKAQKLSKALKACHAKHGKKRSGCEATAHKKFGSAKKKGKAKK
jgi:phosphodiesterase/alkaline phosphatase D-like protein